MRVRIPIANKMTLTIVNTGASAYVVGRRSLANLRRNLLSIDQEKPFFIPANQENMESDGTYNMEVHVGETFLVQEFHVLDNIEEDITLLAMTFSLKPKN